MSTLCGCAFALWSAKVTPLSECVPAGPSLRIVSVYVGGRGLHSSSPVERTPLLVHKPCHCRAVIRAEYCGRGEGFGNWILPEVEEGLAGLLNSTSDTWLAEFSPNADVVRVFTNVYYSPSFFVTYRWGRSTSHATFIC